jgi:threonyl-tRNA synthetase
VRNEKVGYKIRDAEVQKIPYILVVGEKESTLGTVSVRKRGGLDMGVMPIEGFVAAIQEELKPAVKTTGPAQHEGGSVHQ